jgi:hypothetical protein
VKSTAAQAASGGANAGQKEAFAQRSSMFERCAPGSASTEIVFTNAVFSLGIVVLGLRSSVMRRWIVFDL